MLRHCSFIADNDGDKFGDNLQKVMQGINQMSGKNIQIKYSTCPIRHDITLKSVVFSAIVIWETDDSPIVSEK